MLSPSLISNIHPSSLSTPGQRPFSSFSILHSLCTSCTLFPQHSFPLSCPSWLEVRIPLFPALLNLRASAPSFQESQGSITHLRSTCPQARHEEASFERWLPVHSFPFVQSSGSTARPISGLGSCQLKRCTT